MDDQWIDNQASLFPKSPEPRQPGDAHVLPPGARVPTSRWQKSTITYGPVGRVLWTVALFVPEVWLLTQSIFAIFALALWTFWVIPLTLRSIWQPVRRTRRR